MDIPPPLCKRSPRQEQPPGESPWQSLNPLPFYPMYREYQSLFTATQNNKAFTPSSNPTIMTLTWCDLRTLSIWLNEKVWFTRSPVCAVKSRSGKQGDLCMRESKSMTEIYDSPVPRPLPFLSTPTRLVIIRFGMR